MTKRSRVLIDDIGWAEGPRWHDGLLYFSDIYGDRTVQTVAEDGARVAVAEVGTHPSGLGWLPNGDILVVSMDDNLVLRFPPGGSSPRIHADLSELAVAVNDMFVLPSGVAYVGDIGFDYEQGGPRPGRVIRIDPDGSAVVVAEDLILPNGVVATADGSALIVAETMAGRLTRFSIDGDGALRDRETYLAFDDLSRSDDTAAFFDFAVFSTRPVAPDGICADAADNVWVGNPFAPVIRCYDPSGKQIDEVELLQGGTAPAVGGSDGRTLFVATGIPTETFTGRTSRIEICELDA